MIHFERKKMNKKILTFCLCFVFAWVSQAILCQANDQPGNYMQMEGLTSSLSQEVETQKINSVIIYPLRNISGNFQVPMSAISLMLEKELKKEGFQVVPYARLDQILTKMRIRDTSFVDRGTAARLWNELKADVILLGSIDTYSNERDEVYVGLTLRLVGCRDGSIIWANTLAYSGKDFTRLLGFGTLKSVDKLSELLVSGIITGIPPNYVVNNNNKNFVELAGVKVDPPIVGGGKKVKLTVGLIPMMGSKPSIVRVRVGGEIFYLRDDKENYYTGEIISPMTNGDIPLEIIARGPGGKKSNFSFASEMTVDMNSPKITMLLNKTAMRGLKEKDYILFSLKSNELVKKWQVEILDEDNKHVRGGKGYGHLPARLIWRGENDMGIVNKDGSFTFRLSVWDEAGNVGVCDELVRLDTTPPEVNIGVTVGDNPSGDKDNKKKDDEMIFNIDYDGEEIMEEWDLSLFDKESKLIKKISGKGNVDKKISISLEEEIDRENGKELMYFFKAVDLAGNTFETSKYLHLTKNKEQKFTKIQQEETTTGWIQKDF